MEGPRSVEIFKDVEKEGAELGTHLHGEFLEPDRKARPPTTSEKATDYDDTTEWAKLKNLTELFKDVFGHPPLSHRAGRFAASLRTLLYLEKLGYRVDSSFTPFSSVSGVDHGRSPVVPYRPSKRDPYVPGDMEIWEVPITVYPKNRYLHRWIPKVPIRRLRRWLRGKFGTVWLRPTTAGPEDTRWLVERMERVMKDRTVLVMMFHNVELIPNLSPYDAERVIKNLQFMLSFLKSRGYTPITLSGIPELFGY
jgi:hypothetical protein